MTETLTRLLNDEADRVQLDPIDLEAVTRDGARVVGGRRRLVAVAAVSSVVIAAGVTGLATRSDDRAGPGPSRQGATVLAGVSWAQGSVIHGGADSVDVGHTVVRYVRTSVGYVFTDTAGEVWSWRDGTATQVGHTTGRLVADADGSTAGWIDPSVQRKPALFVAFVDQATGFGQAHIARTKNRMSLAPGSYLGAGVIAIDGDQAWWRDDETFYRVTLSWPRPDPSPLPTAPADAADRLRLPVNRTLLTADAEVMVQQDTQTGRVYAVRADGEVALPDTAGDPALLAPDGGHVAFGTDEGRATAHVVDTRTGGVVVLETGAWSALVTTWLDDDTVQVLVAQTEDTDYRFDTCTVSTGRCQVAVPDLGDSARSHRGNGLSFALPSGDLWFPYPHG